MIPEVRSNKSLLCGPPHTVGPVRQHYRHLCLDVVGSLLILPYDLGWAPNGPLRMLTVRLRNVTSVVSGKLDFLLLGLRASPLPLLTRVSYFGLASGFFSHWLAPLSLNLNSVEALAAGSLLLCFGFFFEGLFSAIPGGGRFRGWTDRNFGASEIPPLARICHSHRKSAKYLPTLGGPCRPAADYAAMRRPRLTVRQFGERYSIVPDCRIIGHGPLSVRARVYPIHVDPTPGFSRIRPWGW